MLQAQPVTGRGGVAQAETSLINSMIQLSDLLFEKAKIQQMCRLEAAKPVQNKIIVIGHAGPKLAK